MALSLNSTLLPSNLGYVNIALWSDKFRLYSYIDVIITKPIYYLNLFKNVANTATLPSKEIAIMLF